MMNHTKKSRRSRWCCALSLPLLAVVCIGVAEQEDDLIAVLEFSEVTATDATAMPDAVGIARLRGASREHGPFGTALVFDGIDDYVELDAVPSLGETEAITVEAWVAAGSQGTYAKVVTKGSATDWSFILSQGHPSAKTYFGVRNREGISKTAVCDRFLPLGRWVHLVGTYDGSTVKLYWNGKQVAAAALKGRLAGNGSPVRISGYASGRECFAGAVGTTRIYRRALTQAEVKASYDQDASRYRQKIAMEIRPAFDYPPEPEHDTVADIGNRLELFTDKWLISERDGVELKMHPPVRREIALRFDSPWGGAFASFGTVIKDGDRYRMWYRGMSTLKSPPVTCYAESDDGVHWVKPDLGLVEYRDPSRPELAPSTENNIVMRGIYCHNFTPSLDRSPDCKPEERYKAVANIVPWMTQSSWLTEAEKRAVTRESETCVFSSPDGLHWTMKRREIMRGLDSHTPVFWDGERDEYRMYSSHGVVSTYTSEDALLWTPPGRVKYLDADRNLRFYHLAVAPYFRAPHMFIGIASRTAEGRPFLDRTSPFADMGGKIAKISSHDCVLMTSRNGLHFHRWAEAFLRPGPNIHNWTGHSMFALTGIVPTGPRSADGTPRELSLYFTQHYSLPTAHIVRATIRPDGFVSASAPFAGGELVTRPLRFRGSQLVLNYSTSAAGSIRVELQDEAGQPIPGYTLDDCPEIYGDYVAEAVRWKKGEDLGELAGTPVRLRFVVKDADLYSIRFQ